MSGGTRMDEVSQMIEWLTRRAYEMERLLGMPAFEVVVPLSDEDGLRYSASEQIVVYRQIASQLEGYQRALVAHHDLSTLSDKVIHEYDFRECPVCKRARA